VKSAARPTLHAELSEKGGFGEELHAHQSAMVLPKDGSGLERIENVVWEKRF